VQLDVSTAPVSVIRIDSLLDAAQALAVEGHSERAAELIGEARADLPRLGEHTGEAGS